MRVAADGEAADDLAVVPLGDENRSVRIAAQRLQVPALVGGAPPLPGDADKPALRLGAHGIGELRELLGVGRVGLPDAEVHGTSVRLGDAGAPS